MDNRDEMMIVVEFSVKLIVSIFNYRVWLPCFEKLRVNTVQHQPKLSAVSQTQALQQHGLVLRMKTLSF